MTVLAAHSEAVRLKAPGTRPRASASPCSAPPARSARARSTSWARSGAVPGGRALTAQQQRRRARRGGGGGPRRARRRRRRGRLGRRCARRSPAPASAGGRRRPCVEAARPAGRLRDGGDRRRRRARADVRRRRAPAPVALANKECLVSAGDVFMAAVARRRHRAAAGRFASIRRRLPGAERGGDPRASSASCSRPRAGRSAPGASSSCSRRRRQQALSHPNWSMGAKITIDSATLDEQGARADRGLSPVPGRRRPARGGRPPAVDRALPRRAIATARCWRSSARPTCARRSPLPGLAGAHGGADRAGSTWRRIGTLTFEAPDEARFPALGLARAALRRRQGTPTVLNAANEVAVEAFLEGRIGFLDIARIVETVSSGPTHSACCRSRPPWRPCSARCRQRGVLRGRACTRLPHCGRRARSGRVAGGQDARSGSPDWVPDFLGYASRSCSC